MFQNIENTIKNNYSSYTEMKKNSIHFKKGVEDFKKGQIKDINQNYYWVKKKINKKDWDKIYKYHNNYILLNKTQENGFIGFLAIGIPMGCEEITDLEELRKIDLHRRAFNILPTTFKEINTNQNSY